MTRRYRYAECTTADLDALPGCRYVEDHGRGHGGEFQFGCSAPFDPSWYPSRVALVTALPGGILQIVPLVEASDAALVKALAGLAGSVFTDAKALATFRPAVADACLYAREAVDVAMLDAGGKQVLDAKGIPAFTTEMRRKVGAPLQVAAVLAGDDPVACAEGIDAEMPIEEKD